MVIFPKLRCWNMMAAAMSKFCSNKATRWIGAAAGCAPVPLRPAMNCGNYRCTNCHGAGRAPRMTSQWWICTCSIASFFALDLWRICSIFWWKMKPAIVIWATSRAAKCARRPMPIFHQNKSTSGGDRNGLRRLFGATPCTIRKRKTFLWVVRARCGGLVGIDIKTGACVVQRHIYEVPFRADIENHIPEAYFTRLARQVALFLVGYMGLGHPQAVLRPRRWPWRLARGGATTICARPPKK